ncbi:MAG: Hpt domain-containing protein, partial [Vicinamibacterales bacterium]
MVVEPAPVADADHVVDIAVNIEPPVAAEAADAIVIEEGDADPADIWPTLIAETDAEVAEDLPAAAATTSDDTEPDVYEMAAEIAQLARLRTSLMPQNATFFPDEASDLTDDINALSAEFVEGSEYGMPAAGDQAETGADALLPDEPGDAATIPADAVAADAPFEETSRPRFAIPFASGGSDDLIGHALLELAFESGEAASNTDWSIPTAGQDDAPLDERMRQELRETFAVEAAEYADALTVAAMALERDPESDDALREITRVLHTLKGAATAAGFDAISDDCHTLEDALAAGVDIGPDLVQRMLALAHDLEEETTGDAPPAGSRPDEPLPAAARSAGDLRVDLRRLDGLLNLVGELVINRATLDQRLQRLTASLDELAHMTDRLRRSGQTLERVAGEASLFGPLPSAPPDDRIVALYGHDLRREFDTLEMDRYTDLDVLARELAEVAADIGAVAGEARNLRGDFETVSTHQRRLTNVIQDELMGIRM